MDCLGGRTLPADLGGLGWLEVLKEPVLLLPWQNEGCIACGTKAQLSRCFQCLRPMHLTCAVNRKKIGEQPLCLNCQAATSSFSLNGPSVTGGRATSPWHTKDTVATGGSATHPWQSSEGTHRREEVQIAAMQPTEIDRCFAAAEAAE